MRRILVLLAVAAALTCGATPASAADGELVEVGLRQRVVQLVADGDSTCALTETGEVYCWGAGYSSHPAGRGTLLLVTIGALLIAAGAAMLLVSRSPSTAPRPAAAPHPASGAPRSSPGSSSAT
ncbi:hypothetical protein Ade02nite_25580 [Paractinoplanes deccanensis]|uniref:Regulator of chromosome condensation (RCC1) repeat-containing protein n=1 Tax=Paractinoplanes deccanensis TaxID=113561 RepID=A0ABQ3Y1Q0_9ACTN|nr:RCC1 domain-containing protein [Actinoplanes deccanensis]GID73917.1 hypothetical protein Ade02nite_25580 [Actinoplanes deccanensis]